MPKASDPKAHILAAQLQTFIPRFDKCLSIKPASSCEVVVANEKPFIDIEAHCDDPDQSKQHNDKDDDDITDFIVNNNVVNVESDSDDHSVASNIVHKTHCSVNMSVIQGTASPSPATLAISWAAQPYPDTSHQHLLHHLGQLASRPPYVTSTASAKPWLDGLEHGTFPVLSIAVSLGLHIDMTVSASSDSLGSCLTLVFMPLAHCLPSGLLAPWVDGHMDPSDDLI
ncbi:hypothetical protein C0995_000125 [Termitomyces sp. Mi166|nr:hypothetical protein C0995_000125 [Termitomyces sp. Mi166\